MRVLFCANPDLNYIDGSSVWAQTFVMALVSTRKVEVDYLSRSKPERSHLYQPLRNNHRVRVIDGTAVAAANGTPARRLAPDAQVDVALRLHGENDYDVVVVRGLDIASELARRAPDVFARAWVYLTDIPQKVAEYTPDLQKKVMRIATDCRLLLCQSEGFIDIWLKLVPGLDRDKIRLYTPVIPDIPTDLPQLTERPKRAIYAGKFKPEWKTLDMVSTWPTIAAAIMGAELVMVGDKVHNPPEQPQFKTQMVQALEHTAGVRWLGALSREDVQTELRQARVGLSWRDGSMDDIVEYSTKILEYGGAGCAVVLNRNALHETLLGTDYPLFANTEKEYVAAVQRALADDSVAVQAATRVFELASKHAFSQRVGELSHWLQDFALAERSSVGWVTGPSKRILLAGHDFKFFRDLQKHLEAKGYQFIEDPWTGHCKHDEKKSLTLLQQADIVVCEWALGNLEWYSHHKLSHQRLVSRLHLQGANLAYIERTNWSAVDSLIFVCDAVRKGVVRKISALNERNTVVISNLLDPEKFKPSRKMASAEFTLGMIGIVPSRKRVDRAIALLEKLLAYDDRFCLRIKGAAPSKYAWLMRRPAEREYYAGLFSRINASSKIRAHVIFDPPSDDVNEWLQLIGYILSPSDFESFHMAVGEGMLAGCKPLVWDWDGAGDLWPKDSIVRDTEEAASIILARRGAAGYEGFDSRRFVREKHSPERVVDQWCQLLG